jgi:CO/xanthine dehydrogenase Mo-binding subunit
VIYDSGDYPAALERARALSGYDEVRRAQPAERRAGRYRGVAVTAFLESTGAGQESARVEVAGDGTVRVTVGSPSNGQGHATTLAQVCAARLGVPVERVALTSGDTAAMEQGTGTFGSRMAVMAGNAVAQAAAALRRQALNAAAELLEVAVSDLELTDGVIAVRGVPGRSVDLAQLARLQQARDGSPLLRADAVFAPDTPTCFAGGAHAAVVAVDVETGVVEVERYVVVHDCGTVINPMVVEGQVHGGVAHGVGNALWEAMVYDAAGQLLTADFPDYAVPQAPWIPPIEVEHQEHPSPYNPEGIKGAGEGGTIGALATIAGAVEDALAPLRLALNDLPIRSEDLARLCRPLRAR